MLNALYTDLSYSLRVRRKAPGFSAVVITALMEYTFDGGQTWRLGQHNNCTEYKDNSGEVLLLDHSEVMYLMSREYEGEDPSDEVQATRLHRTHPLILVERVE